MHHACARELLELAAQVARGLQFLRSHRHCCRLLSAAVGAVVAVGAVGRCRPLSPLSARLALVDGEK